MPLNHLSPFPARRWAGLLLIPAALLTGCKGEQKPAMNPLNAPVTVEVAEVQVGALQQSLAAVGSLSSPQSTPIAPQIGGKLVALNIEQGALAKKGMVLARLDDAALRAQLMAAQSTLANARQVYARDQQIANTGALSAQEVDRDAAAVRSAEASLAQAQANLDYTTLRAPFAGTLGIRLVSMGTYVAPGTTLVTLQSLDPLYLDFSLPQNELAQVRAGQAVHFSVDGVKGDFSGKVLAVNPALNADSRSIQVRASVPNPGRQLKPGMFANVQLQTGSVPQALFVPQQAVVAEGVARKIWVVDGSNNATLRDVTLGQYQTNLVQVTSGLNAGERVIAAGLQKMRPKAKLVIKPYQPIRNPRLDLTNPAEMGGGA